MTTLYRDIETGETVTLEQLRAEYTDAMQDGTHDAMTFAEFIDNCLTAHNGTLDPIPSDDRAPSDDAPYAIINGHGYWAMAYSVTTAHEIARAVSGTILNDDGDTIATYER